MLCSNSTKLLGKIRGTDKDSKRIIFATITDQPFFILIISRTRSGYSQHGPTRGFLDLMDVITSTMLVVSHLLDSLSAFTRPRKTKLDLPENSNIPNLRGHTIL